MWRSNGVLVLINEVNPRRGRLIVEWVTVFGFNQRCTGSISECNQPPRATQPGHPFVGKHNEYQRATTLCGRLGSKRGYGSCVGSR